MTPEELRYCNEVGKVSPGALLLFDRYVTDEAILNWPILTTAVATILIDLVLPLVLMWGGRTIYVVLGILLACFAPLFTGYLAIEVVYPRMRKLVIAGEIKSLACYRYLMLLSCTSPAYHRGFRRATVGATLRTWPVLIGGCIGVLCVGSVPFLLVHVGVRSVAGISLAMLWAVLAGVYLLGRLWRLMYTRSAIKLAPIEIIKLSPKEGRGGLTAPAPL